MRVISQGGMLDYPYDNSLVFLNENSLSNDFYIKIQLCGAPEIEIIAKYSSREKALKAMEMLRERYKKLETMKVLASGTAEYMEKALATDEMIKHYNTYCDMEVFQFPQDDEIEV